MDKMMFGLTAEDYEINRFMHPIYSLAHTTDSRIMHQQAKATEFEFQRVKRHREPDEDPVLTYEEIELYQNQGEDEALRLTTTSYDVEEAHGFDVDDPTGRDPFNHNTVR